MSTFDVLDFIMKVECDGVGDREYIDGVANLVKYGVINHLQGSWQRAAMGLVSLGYIDTAGNVLGYPEDSSSQRDACPRCGEERVEGYFDEEDEHPEAWKLGWVDHEEAPDANNPFDYDSQDYLDWEAGWKAAVAAHEKAGA